MDTIPATVFIALGAVLAALLTGFFSFINLVSAKEGKVSEFRQQWIDGLRGDISAFAAAIHELVRIHATGDRPSPRELLTLASEPYRTAREALGRIQLRLNPKHLTDDPESNEAKLIREIERSRQAFLEEDFGQVVNCCEDIRRVAAPLLKSEWERVKKGELGYRIVRILAWVVLATFLLLFIGGAAWLLVESVPRAGG